MTDTVSLCYSAPCPGCAAEVEWRVVAGGADLDHTDVDYQIDCDACTHPHLVPVPADRAVPVYRPQVSSLTWLRRPA